MTIQVELIYSLVIMVCLGVFFVYAGKKVALADPTVKPKGIVLVVETGVKAIDDYMKSIMPKKMCIRDRDRRLLSFKWLWLFIT